METVFNAENSSSLLSEIRSTRNLLGYAVKTILEGTLIDTIREPILTMASIGVEKLYKLTMGFIATRDGNPWPTVKEMKSFGHGINELHARIYDDIGARAATSTPFVQDTVKQTGKDPLVAQMLEVLDLYGNSGRFFYLDRLGGSQRQDDPEYAWVKLENLAIAQPNVQETHEAYVADLKNEDLHNEFLHRLDTCLAQALENIWRIIVVSGNNGLLGDSGRAFAAEVCWMRSCR